jgi:hypothetical protein
MKKFLVVLLFGFVAGSAALLSLSCNTTTSGPNFQGPVQTLVAANYTYTVTNTNTCLPSRTPTRTPTGTLTPPPTATATTTGTVSPTPICPF